MLFEVLVINAAVGLRFVSPLRPSLHKPLYPFLLIFGEARANTCASIVADQRDLVYAEMPHELVDVGCHRALTVAGRGHFRLAIAA